MQKAQARNIEVRAFPDKLFYKIGEVSRITRVEPYVLRYWETEFSFLRPRKSKAGQRVYIKKDLELIMEIKRLLYDEKYTIEGVRKRLGSAEAGRKPQPSDNKTPSEAGSIERVKFRLREILNQIH